MCISSFPGRLNRRAISIIGAAVLFTAHFGAHAAWPERPIKLVVPIAPGGSNDTIARVLASKLAVRLGQPVVVENKAGAGGTIGTDAVAKSPADGYTLLFGSSSITTNAATSKKLPYDLLKDLQPIGKIGAGPFVVVVSNDVKAKNLREFIELARANPKTISYGSSGAGGLNHIGVELFANIAKVDLLHVPYRGMGPAFTDLMGGQVKMLLPSLASVTPHIRGGKMRALAITSGQRSPMAPEIPTVAEAGLPGFQLEVWWGLLGPAGLPEPVLKKLNEELNAVLALPEVRDLLSREGAAPQPGTSEEFRSLIRSELVRWVQLIKDANIQME